jgi:cellulose synthase/poly-beta-1,6-N-acetylglucosamine synthase-like glycosyltransferase
MEGILAPDASAQQRAERDPYHFLVGSVIDAGALQRAGAEAARCGVSLHEALLATGRVSLEAYAAALARSLAIPFAGWDAVLEPRAVDTDGGASTALSATIAGRAYRVLCAEQEAPGAMSRRVADLQARGVRVALATRWRIDAALDGARRTRRLDRAVNGLLRRSPEDSAGGVMIWTWQLAAAAVVAGLIVGGMATAPEAMIAALTGLASLPLLCISLSRAVALGELLSASSRRRRQGSSSGAAASDRAMPVYSVLVPLFREAGMLPGLVQALNALEYPRARLEVLLILEAADIETQASVLRLGLPPGFRLIVVPDAAPRTKPKALNYALQFAGGDYVVVYDAEDRPQPDQLLRALHAFRRSPPHIGCVQAQLNIYNPHASWFTRQFTVEYSALFDAVLPALARLGLPVPLGGTSNHFPRAVLVGAGGWDPFNVTEDADLGFRLARRGWRTAVLDSTTWEEAPVSFARWFRQRTRWLKGWMQTYLVHTRRPWRLGAELGWRGTLGFHALMGGLVMSALVHPLFYLLLLYHAVSGQLFSPAGTAADATLWTIAWCNLGAGYFISIVVGALSAWRRGQPGLTLSALVMPLCWLLVSAAAYRALWQLAADPYLWEKTEHGPPPRATRRTSTVRRGRSNGSARGAARAFDS